MSNSREVEYTESERELLTRAALAGDPIELEKCSQCRRWMWARGGCAGHYPLEVMFPMIRPELTDRTTAEFWMEFDERRRAQRDGSAGTAETPNPN